MEYTINQIIDYYSKSSLEFVNMFVSKTLPKQVDGNRTTALGVSGLVIPLSGAANFSLKDEKYVMNEGTILHAGSQMPLEIVTVGDIPWEYAVIHYRTFVNSTIDLKNEHFHIKVKQMALIKEQALKLLKYHTEPGNLSKLQAKRIFMELLLEIINQSKKYHDDSNSFIVPKAVNYIQEYYNESFTITELASFLNIERRRFSELFEKNVGMTPIQYLTEYRILKAKEYLRLGEHSVAEVAELVGYEDNFYFSRVFKKLVGISPKQYQKNLKENYVFID